MFSKIVLSASIAAAASGAELTWNGRNAAFDNEANWENSNGCNPAKDLTVGCDGYNSVVFGAAGATVIATVTSPETNMGMKLTFGGKAKLVLGDGTGKAKLIFNTPPATATPATFLPGQAGTESAAYDVRCPTNWKNADETVASKAPCGGDTAIFTTGSFATSSGGFFSARSIRVSGGSSDSPGNISCPDAWPSAGISINLGVDCNKWTGADKCDADGYDLSSAECGKTTELLKGPVNCGSPATGTWVEGPSGVQGQIFNGDGKVVDWGMPERDGNTITLKKKDGGVLYTAVYNKGGKVTSLKDASNADICELPAGGFDPKVGASMDEAGGGGSGVIIGAVVGALVVIAVAFVVIKKRGGGGGGEPERSVVSFENPLYDNSGKPLEQKSEAAYSDVNALNTDGSSSGYMDVPVGGGYDGGDQFGGFGDEPGYADPGSTAGYMDVNAAAGGGYMDVTASAGGGYMDVTASPEEEEDV